MHVNAARTATPGIVNAAPAAAGTPTLGLTTPLADRSLRRGRPGRWPAGSWPGAVAGPDDRWPPVPTAGAWPAAAGCPRTLHPIAWWIWALGLATAVSRTTNPLLLLLVLAVLGVVVANRRSDAPWARAFKYYLCLALIVVAIRVVFRSVFGGDVEPGACTCCSPCPTSRCPRGPPGVQLGGPVTLEGTLAALYDGLRLGTLLCCLGAANALANPKRALRVLPGALYELGVAVVVSLSVAPQLVESVQRVRRARKLRGGADRGLPRPAQHRHPGARGCPRALAAPGRGHGLAGLRPHRRGVATRPGGSPGPHARRAWCGLCVGAYGLLDGSAPGPLGPPRLCCGGAVLCCVGPGPRAAAGCGRSQYRPDPWRAPEWVVVGSRHGPGRRPDGRRGLQRGQTQPVDRSAGAGRRCPLVPALAILVAAVAAVARLRPPRRGGHGPVLPVAERRGAGRPAASAPTRPVEVPA